jgi:hypothetical protein
MNEIFLKVIFPVLVSVIAYFIINLHGEFKKRKRDSRLGAVILDEIIEEVKAGKSIFEGFSKMDTSSSEVVNKMNYPPKKSWRGLDSINDDVLLRIIELSKNDNKNFSPKRIRHHCKNYFEHMIPNIEPMIKGHSFIELKNIANGSESNSGYLESTKNVLDLLIETRKLLMENSKKWFPK